MRMPYDAPFYVGGLFGLVTYNESSGEFLSVGAIRLVFYLKSGSGLNWYSIQFRDVMSRYLLNYRSPLIKVSFGNDESLTEGLDVSAFQMISLVMSEYFQTIIIFRRIQYDLHLRLESPFHWCLFFPTFAAMSSTSPDHKEVILSIGFEASLILLPLVYLMFFE